VSDYVDSYYAEKKRQGYFADDAAYTVNESRELAIDSETLEWLVSHEAGQRHSTGGYFEEGKGARWETVGASLLWPRPELDDVSLYRSEVITRYVERLKPEYRELLFGRYGFSMTEVQIGASRGTTQQAESQRIKSAHEALVREIALDDPDFVEYDQSLKTGKRGRPPRDRAAELEAAERVLRKSSVLAPVE
jgi:hypothetical protein